MLLLCALLVAPVVAASSPAEAVAAAHADMVKLTPEARSYTRYLTLYAVPPQLKNDFYGVLNFQVNSLSRESEFVPPRRINADLVAVNYRDYNWPPEVWERLAKADPYFHQKAKLEEDAVVRTVWPGGKQGGKFFEAGVYKERHKKGDVIDVAAGWLPTKEITELREGTYSEAPILRADWFINQTAVQADRVAGYYDFLALGKKEADFENLIGADKETSRRVKKEIAAALARSGVTLKNRGIVRFQAITGAYWLTQDYKKSVDRQNVLRLLDLDREPPQGDASERYGTLPNGLFAFWLQNDKGERQDTAPDFIASDRQATGNDTRVHAGKSCITCHAEGIRPIDDYVRKIYRGSIKLNSTDYDKFLRLRQLYLSDLEGNVKKDQQEYANALVRLNGPKWTPALNARLYNRVWDVYAEEDLGPNEFARELGVKTQDMVNAFKKYKPLDPVLAGLIQVPPVPIIRDHAEESFGTAQTIIRSVR